MNAPFGRSSMFSSSMRVKRGSGPQAPWVMVAGGFHQMGGMDKANAALASYLIEQNTPVHLVGHRVDRALGDHPLVTVHSAPRPAGAFLLGEWYLEKYGRKVAQQVTARWPEARVLVNGGNCRWADINWVHCVHHAWPRVDEGAPAWFRLKNRLAKTVAKRRERASLREARLVIANSERTRQDLIAHLNLDPERVKKVYLGTDAAWGQATAEERRAARAGLNVPAQIPLLVFVGALGHDRNKGFDTLLAAWRKLRAQTDWQARLIVAGGGQAVAEWRERIARAGLSEQIRLLGFSDRVAELLAAADLLVSPARYEAYGLNVREAICRGVPALVSGRAGVAEHYPPELAEMILPDAEDVDGLAGRLLQWRSKAAYWKDRFLPLADKLRSYTWADMARRIVAQAEASAGAAQPDDVFAPVGRESRGVYSCQ